MRLLQHQRHPRDTDEAMATTTTAVGQQSSIPEMGGAGARSSRSGPVKLLAALGSRSPLAPAAVASLSSSDSIMSPTSNLSHPAVRSDRPSPSPKARNSTVSSPHGNTSSSSSGALEASNRLLGQALVSPYLSSSNASGKRSAADAMMMPTVTAAATTTTSTRSRTKQQTAPSVTLLQRPLEVRSLAPSSSVLGRSTDATKMNVESSLSPPQSQLSSPLTHTRRRLLEGAARQVRRDLAALHSPERRSDIDPRTAIIGNSSISSSGIGSSPTAIPPVRLQQQQQQQQQPHNIRYSVDSPSVSSLSLGSSSAAAAHTLSAQLTGQGVARALHRSPAASSSPDRPSHNWQAFPPIEEGDAHTHSPSIGKNSYQSSTSPSSSSTTGSSGKPAAAYSSSNGTRGPTSTRLQLVQPAKGGPLPLQSPSSTVGKKGGASDSHDFEVDFTDTSPQQQPQQQQRRHDDNSSCSGSIEDTALRDIHAPRTTHQQTVDSQATSSSTTSPEHRFGDTFSSTAGMGALQLNLSPDHGNAAGAASRHHLQEQPSRQPQPQSNIFSQYRDHDGAVAAAHHKHHLPAEAARQQGKPTAASLSDLEFGVHLQEPRQHRFINRDRLDRSTSDLPSGVDFAVGRGGGGAGAAATLPPNFRGLAVNGRQHNSKPADVAMLQRGAPQAQAQSRPTLRRQVDNNYAASNPTASAAISAAGGSNSASNPAAFRAADAASAASMYCAADAAYNSAVFSAADAARYNMREAGIHPLQGQGVFQRARAQHADELVTTTTSVAGRTLGPPREATYQQQQRGRGGGGMLDASINARSVSPALERLQQDTTSNSRSSGAVAASQGDRSSSLAPVKSSTYKFRSRREHPPPPAVKLQAPRVMRQAPTGAGVSTTTSNRPAFY